MFSSYSICQYHTLLVSLTEYFCLLHASLPYTARLTKNLYPGSGRVFGSRQHHVQEIKVRASILDAMKLVHLSRSKPICRWAEFAEEKSWGSSAQQVHVKVLCPKSCCTYGLSRKRSPLPYILGIPQLLFNITFISQKGTAELALSSFSLPLLD